jgi:hypothetical protein
MTNNQPRKHHYISRFYLAGFSKSGGSKANLHVHDITRKNYFVSSALDTPTKRDFNRIEIDGHEYSLETALSGLETVASKAFERVSADRKWPENDDLAFLLNFMCLFSMRNPRARDYFCELEKLKVEKIMDSVVSSEDTFLGHMKQLKDNIGIDQNVSFQHMKDFIENKRYKLEIPRERLIQTEFKVFDTVLPTFFNRYWTFIWSDQESGEFITSDHPVSLISLLPPTVYPTGFGSPKTEVVFPVSRYVAMMGVFEDTYPVEVHANKKLVANLNGRTKNFAINQVYSAHRNFDYLDTDGTIKTSINLGFKEVNTRNNA